MRIEREIRASIKDIDRAVINLNTLPALAKRQLSTTELTPMYIAAKKHLATLSKVDEIKEIADKHSAIAHYAKQIQDKSLLHYAERIYARAIAGIGDLLAELGTAKERVAVAKQHGITPSVALSAYEISHLPNRARDSLIERDPPATFREIASAGKKLMPAPDSHKWRREGYSRFEENQTPFGQSDYVVYNLLHAIHGAEPGSKPMLDQRLLVAGLTAEERVFLRKKLAPVIEWLDSYDQILEKGAP